MKVIVFNLHYIVTVIRRRLCLLRHFIFYIHANHNSTSIQKSFLPLGGELLCININYCNLRPSSKSSHMMIF